jgi:hypothetical protein
LIRILDDWAKNLFGQRVCDAAADALERIGTPEAHAAVAAWRSKT